jgi:hypothetical protein
MIANRIQSTEATSNLFKQRQLDASDDDGEQNNNVLNMNGIFSGM